MVGQDIKTITDLVWDYFNDYPEDELTPNKVFKALRVKYRKLKIKYSSINSAIYRFRLQGRIFRTSRGTYVLKIPLSEGQLRIDDIIKSEANEMKNINISNVSQKVSENAFNRKV